VTEARHSPKLPSGWRRLVLSLALFVASVTGSAAESLVAAPQAAGHLVHSNGVWTYRYLTRGTGNAGNDCYYGAGAVDPLNVIFYQYGEGTRMNSHVQDETHWHHYAGWAPRSHQVICGDMDCCPGDYSLNIFQEFDDQEGHGSWDSETRAHLRLWYAPHGHSELANKWSTIDAHHERLVCCWGHDIDEPWDRWEYHVGNELVAHNHWYDYYYRVGGQPISGYWDNGYITRVGGLHWGSY
jgi:hypothetical protein